MTKPTPIEEWIAENFEYIPDAKWGAQQTARYILEELGVSALLKDITTSSDKYCADPEDPRRFEVHLKYLQMQYGDLLTKLKGEKDAD